MENFKHGLFLGAITKCEGGYEKADKYREHFGVFFGHGASNNDAGPTMS